jgi:dTDP-4-dehydrorhamnose reductase
MLGTAFSKLFDKCNIQYVAPTSKELDVRDFSSFRNFKGFTHVINCTAYTAVDDAEVNVNDAIDINVNGVVNIAKWAVDNEVIPVHFSTDYVFDGTNTNGYLETDIPNPLGVYGKTKLDGENALLALSNKAIIIRTSWLYAPWGKNFVKTMLSLFSYRNKISIVCDEYGNPTYAPYLAQVTIDLLDNEYCKGIYNCSNKGIISWFDFANEILNLSRKIGIISNDTIELVPITASEYRKHIIKKVAIRPGFSSLRLEKVEAVVGMALREWIISLEDCLFEIKKVIG